MMRHVTLVLLFAACSPPCDLYCPKPQTLVLVDGSGKPVEPARVVEPNGRTHDCSASSPFLTCGTDRVTFDQRSFEAYRLRVEAKSGEVFEGEFTPKLEDTGMVGGSCSCVQEKRFVDQTITVTVR